MASTRMALAATLVTFLAVAAVASATASATPRPRLMVSTLDGAAGANTATASNADLPSHELAATLAASLIHPAIGVAPDDAAVVLHLALVQDDAARSQRLEETFWSVSNPGSPREGQYLSHKDVRALMSPSTELLDAVRQWVRDAGVDDANVELSPWRDHMFVRTDVATVRRLTSLEVNVHQHRSTDPALARRHVLLASSSELPHDHVHAARVSLVRLAGTVAADASTPAPARQPARGRGSLRHALEQAANAEASAQPPAYPFSFWPPSPIASAEAMPSGRLLIESIVTCYSWSEESYPFKYSPPALEGTALSPCYFGGEIESLTVTLTDSQGNEQTDIWEVTSYSNGRGCAAANFVVDVCDGFYCTNDNIEGELMTLGVCVFTMDSFTMVADEAYNVTVTQTLESSMNGGARQWLGYPDALPLRVASTAAKLPSTLQSFYNIPTEPVACASTNRQSVGVLQPSTSGFYSYSDLDQFYNEAGISTSESLLVTFVGKATGANLTRYLDLQQWTPTSVSNNQDEPGDETSLDVQWISGMAPGAHTDVYHGGYFLSSTGGAVDPLLAAIVAIQYSDTPPLVLSMSYGGPEPSGRKRTTFENAWLAFGTMGISVLASSGDGGAFRPSVSAEATCQYPGVNYPASSPYVTGVGATQMLDVGGTGVAQEVVASIQTGSIITSGGGFSSTFSVPSYQAEAVAAYRARYPNAPVGRGRGVPDVALFGHNFKVVVGGSTNLVDGTSCSAPSFGGIVTLWNDARLRADMPALGFLNPKLYKLWKNTTGAFNDIVFGSNNCAGGNGGSGVCCSTGYQASPGWDPMTGIGSPNFLTVANALMGDGMLWTNGNCTISQRACGAATCGSNPTALPTWAIAVVVVGGIACCIGVACACVACNKTRRLPPQPAMNAYNPNGLVPVQGAGGGYVAPSPAYVAQPVPGPQGGYAANQYGAPSNQYGAPSNQYGAPTGQYGGPSYGGAPPAYDSQQPPPAYGYAQPGQGNSYVQMP